MMTLRDLQAVYAGEVRLTVMAYHPDGKYYSFRSYGDEPLILIDLKDEDILSKEVISIVPSKGNLWVDVKHVLEGMEDEDDIEASIRDD